MNPLYTLWLALRTVVFYLGYAGVTVFISLTAQLMLLVLPRRYAQRWIRQWCRFACWWFGACCGVRYQWHGLEHLPQAPFVVLANHQSGLETFLFQNAFLPLHTVLKRELLSIPFFGWGLAILDPVAIDRGSPRDAMRQLAERGVEHINGRNNVLVFPEGTRHAVGQHGKYARGGAGIACMAQVPVVPVAHNCGQVWPARRFLKFPGTVHIHVGPAIATAHRNPKDVTDEARTWIDARLQELAARP